MRYPGFHRIIYRRKMGGWLESRVKITYKIPRLFSFEYGVFSGPGKLTLRNDAYVDSYDSSIAPWSEATRRKNGTVGTNRTGNRSIDLRDRTAVFGDAYVGVGGSPAAHIKVAKNADITGIRSALTAAEDTTPKIMPVGGGIPYNLALNNNDTFTFSGGINRLNGLQISDDAVLTISGDVTLYVE
ncbi:MAG: hypothetical protein JRI86_12230, partial [Deltaproteobacteria bacterium]|nr:hypothetical protein [Deltaproteobacteria bacterium]